MDNRDLQRWSAVAAGALLAAIGMKKGGRQGLLLSLAGGALGVLGYMRQQQPSVIAGTRAPHWQLPRERLLDDAKAFGRGKMGKSDRVEEASEESFPASDAPAHTPTTSIGGHETHQRH